MKSELALLTEQFRQVYENDPWYGASVKTILHAIPPEIVFEPPASHVHSIAELVAHIINWRLFLHHRLASDTSFVPDQEETFNWKRLTNDPATAWNNLLKQLDQNQQQLMALLEQQDDSLLNQPVTAKPYTFGYLLHGVLQHDIYHLGQISLIHHMHEKKQSA